MNDRRGRDQRIGNVAGFERFIRATVGEKAAFAVSVDERDEPSGLKLGVADEMGRDPDRREPRRLALKVGGADASDEVDRRAERGEPRRLIRRRPARPERDPGPPVRSLRQRSLGTHDDVGHHVADDQDAGSGRDAG